MEGGVIMRKYFICIALLAAFIGGLTYCGSEANVSTNENTITLSEQDVINRFVEQEQTYIALRDEILPYEPDYHLVVVWDYTSESYLVYDNNNTLDVESNENLKRMVSLANELSLYRVSYDGDSIVFCMQMQNAFEIGVYYSATGKKQKTSSGDDVFINEGWYKYSIAYT